MNCFYHPDKVAVAQCSECNKGLCHECATKYTRPICESCAKSVNKEITSYYMKPLIVAIVSPIIAYLICSSQSLPLTETMAWCFAPTALYVGWRFIGFLEQYLQGIIVFGCLFYIYYIAKFLFSIYVGGMVLPFYLPYCVYKIIKIKKQMK